MKQFIFTFFGSFLLMIATAQKKVAVNFINDYKDVYHLSLIIYTPDGKNEIRVSDVKPGETKSYLYPAGTEIFIADWQQEAYAMKGNDIKKSGAIPYRVLSVQDNKKVIQLSTVIAQIKVKAVLTKPNANEVLGTWVIDLRPTPDSKPYLKDFKFTKIDGNEFYGEFYGYLFEGGLLNTDWDKIYFGFTTSDQSGTYYHSGYIEGDKIYGMSLSENRKLMLPWRGEKKNE